MSLAYTARAGLRVETGGCLHRARSSPDGLGQIATTPSLPWYDGLAKPWFTPPNWVFGPIWTVLYAVMGYLFYRILRMPDRTPGRSAAISAFVVLLIVNTLWSYAFFLGPFLCLGPDRHCSAGRGARRHGRVVRPPRSHRAARLPARGDVGRLRHRAQLRDLADELSWTISPSLGLGIGQSCHPACSRARPRPPPR